MIDRITMVLADYDDMYIENLGNYIKLNYPDRFKIEIFNNQDVLENYILNNKNIDILLVDLEMFLDAKKDYKIDCIIAMQKRDYPVDANIYRINKYQNIDDLLKVVNNIFENMNKSVTSTGESEINRNETKTSVNITKNDIVEETEKSIKIIGVYSVNGGSGKTTISVALSVFASKMGKQVFYLNMENFNSTLNFFKGRVDTFAENNSKKNINELKDFKLTRCIDDNYDVHYFLPDENFLESRFKDIYELIEYIKLGGEYDYIIIDMDSSDITRDLKLINVCDSSICIMLSNNISKIKMRSFEKSIKLVNSKMGADILKNTRFILNKVMENDELIEETLILKKPIEKKIVYNHNIAKWNNIENIISNNDLKTVIYEILKW